MDWHIRLAEVAPGYELVRIHYGWCLYDKAGKFVKHFRTCDEAIAHAKGLTERAAQSA